ncbi:MAG: DUF4249 domain-containing protein, partial [Prevotellaceae bacterium]|nr:DUF4249 domain-containing protein [Prevotellaceae bacterium]
LTKTIRYFGGDTTPVVANAQVFINDEQLTFNAEQGAYLTSSNFFIAAGNTYKLRILYDGEEYLAEELASSPIYLLPEIRLIPINLEGDTTRYVPPMVCAGVLYRDNINNNYMRIMEYYNGVKRQEKITQYSVSYVPYGIGNFVPASSFAVVGRGSFKLEGREDSTYYCPFDTIGFRVHSINEAQQQFIASARTESNGGGNPMFGGAPTNVECNISGENVLGCFGVAVASSMVNVVLPMNKKTLDHDEYHYVCMQDSTVRIHIHNEGIATYTSGGSTGLKYFEMEQITPAAKGFRTLDGRQFRMVHYGQFYELVGPRDTLMWTLDRRRRW